MTIGQVAHCGNGNLYNRLPWYERDINRLTDFDFSVTVIDDDIVAVTFVEIDRHAEIDSVGQLLAEVVDDTVGVADVDDESDAMDAVGDEDPDTVAVNETETVELNDDVALNDGDRVAVIDTDEVLHAVAETELQIDAENDAVIVGELEGERDTEKEEVNVGELE